MHVYIRLGHYYFFLAGRNTGEGLILFYFFCYSWGLISKEEKENNRRKTRGNEGCSTETQEL